MFGPIRFIYFDQFKSLGHTPRYPNNSSITTDLINMDLSCTFVIFVSHCWLRGSRQTDGYCGFPHPDNSNDDKYHLTITAIDLIWKTMAPGMSKCAIWFDYGCINQDLNPAAELKQLDQIVSCCDCMLTPIHDNSTWTYPVSVNNWYEEYKAPNWNHGPHSYLARAWCRVEMMFAASIPVPLHTNTPNRIHKLAGVLKVSLSEGRRPHILYGSKEMRENRPFIVLPPLQHSYFTKYTPETGRVTVSSDKPKIKSLIDQLRPYMKLIKEGYVGELSGQLKHGWGVYTFPTGAKYTGQWRHDTMEGHGLLLSANGSCYVGNWREDRMEGHCTLKSANGGVYHGKLTNTEAVTL